jgi:hypothetical protein
MRGSTSHRLFGPWLFGLFTIVASLLVHSEARADLYLSIGSRFEPFRYTAAYFPNASGTTFRPDGGSGPGSDSFQSTSLNPYLALFFAQKYGIMLSLDIAYAKSSGETQAMGMAMPTTDNNSFFQFGVGLGTKIYLTTPRSQKVVPYLYLDFFKYFASISTDNMAISGDQASAQASLRSPTGGTLAVGAEYFLGPGFSIGSEIFGLRLSVVDSEYKDMAMTRHSSSYTQVAFYTGITLNYRFQVSSSVQAAEEENTETPKPRRHAAPPAEAAPPPPPAPSPEAVD